MTENTKKRKGQRKLNAIVGNSSARENELEYRLLYIVSLPARDARDALYSLRDLAENYNEEKKRSKGKLPHDDSLRLVQLGIVARENQTTIGAPIRNILDVYDSYAETLENLLPHGEDFYDHLQRDELIVQEIIRKGLIHGKLYRPLQDPRQGVRRMRAKTLSTERPIDVEDDPFTGHQAIIVVNEVESYESIKEFFHLFSNKSFRYALNLDRNSSLSEIVSTRIMERTYRHLL